MFAVNNFIGTAVLRGNSPEMADTAASARKIILKFLYYPIIQLFILVYFPIESTLSVLRRLRAESFGFLDFYVRLVKEISEVKRMYSSLLLNRICRNLICLFLNNRIVWDLLLEIHAPVDLGSRLQCFSHRLSRCPDVANVVHLGR